jgi:hypothetical protein
MISQRAETTRRPIYSIPGLIEMEKEFDQIMITGSYAPPPQFSSYITFKMRRNVTDYAQEEVTDLLKLYFLTLSQAVESHTHLSRYVSIKSIYQNNLTESAREDLSGIDNKQVAKQATIILDILESQLQYYDFTTLPPIRVAELEDGGIILEWIFENFRMGFNLETNHDKSGYFLVSKESAGEIRSSGYLKGLKLESIIQSLLTIVLNNLIDYA